MATHDEVMFLPTGAAQLELLDRCPEITDASQPLTIETLRSNTVKAALKKLEINHLSDPKYINNRDALFAGSLHNYTEPTNEKHYQTLSFTQENGILERNCCFPLLHVFGDQLGKENFRQHLAKQFIKRNQVEKEEKEGKEGKGNALVPTATIGARRYERSLYSGESIIISNHKLVEYGLSNHRASRNNRLGCLRNKTQRAQLQVIPPVLIRPTLRAANAFLVAKAHIQPFTAYYPFSDAITVISTLWGDYQQYEFNDYHILLFALREIAGPNPAEFPLMLRISIGVDVENDGLLCPWRQDSTDFLAVLSCVLDQQLDIESQFHEPSEYHETIMALALKGVLEADQLCGLPLPTWKEMAKPRGACSNNAGRLQNKNARLRERFLLQKLLKMKDAVFTGNSLQNDALRQLIP